MVEGGCRSGTMGSSTGERSNRSGPSSHNQLGQCIKSPGERSAADAGRSAFTKQIYDGRNNIKRTDEATITWRDAVAGDVKKAACARIDPNRGFNSPKGADCHIT